MKKLLLFALLILFAPHQAHAAISIVATTTNSGASTAVSCTKPTGTASGDVVNVIINFNTGVAVVADNNGATPFTKDFTSINYGTANVYVFSRYAGGSEPATYNFSSDQNDRWGVECITTRGVNATSKYDVAPSASNFSYAQGAGSLTATSSPITTVTDNAFIITSAAVDTGVTTPPNTFPADSFTKLVQIDTSQPLAASYKIKTPAGLQASVSWDYGGVTVLPGVTTFALKPAVTTSFPLTTVLINGVTALIQGVTVLIK